MPQVKNLSFPETKLTVDLRVERHTFDGDMNVIANCLIFETTIFNCAEHSALVAVRQHNRHCVTVETQKGFAVFIVYQHR